MGPDKEAAAEAAVLKLKTIAGGRDGGWQKAISSRVGTR